jgi:hypothetical protein
MLAQGFSVETQLHIFEQRPDGEIWVTAESPHGQGVYKFPAAGGHAKVDSGVEGPEPRIGDTSDELDSSIAREAKTTRDTREPS